MTSQPDTWGLVVNEVRLNSTGTPAAAWWATESAHFTRLGKLRHLAATPVGALVELGPYPKDDIEFMRDHLVEKGVHQTVLTVRRWAEQPHLPKCRKAAPCRLCAPAIAASPAV